MVMGPGFDRLSKPVNAHVRLNANLIKVAAWLKCSTHIGTLALLYGFSGICTTPTRSFDLLAGL